LDISTVRFGGEFDLEITHPQTGDKTDIVFTLVGGDSKEYRAGEIEQYRLAAQTEDKEPEDFAHIPYIHCIKGWKGIEKGKEPVEFTPEAAAEIFLDEGWSWMYNRVIGAVLNRGNFSQPPKKS